MTDQLSLTAPVAATEAADYAWRAASDDGYRHAFPPVPEGRLPGRSPCGERWTAAYGKRGAGWCPLCIAELRDSLRAISVALAAAGISLDRGAPEPDQPPSPGDIQRRCWTLYMHPAGNSQCRLFNGHEGDCDFGIEAVDDRGNHYAGMPATAGQ